MDHRDRIEIYGCSHHKMKVNEQRMTGTITIYNDDDEEEEICFPISFEVCSTCNGKGSYVNPSIDSHGITSDEWETDWDDESREDYFSGAYDVTCGECHGKRVVPVINEASLDKDLQEKFIKYNEMLESFAESDRISAAERAMGA